MREERKSERRKTCFCAAPCGVRLPPRVRQLVWRCKQNITRAKLSYRCALNKRARAKQNGTMEVIGKQVEFEDGRCVMFLRKHWKMYVLSQSPLPPWAADGSAVPR
jgi:hypothetical protein